ncbi:peptide-N(4)-(N-acetyl-beta-glucosaminyl)asparagine amidase-like isoform X2 [Corticium candelabrum]|uniref:peptide-N(4)-(N-acetyl-beta- glucosaminyl)asparagine amidase-like isoform X2 n=1 Tax=Corticium candelabrum TaxID=121492 RepID=UPI002E26FA8A|nr:peptide-N(4)-(N-acetyl-beta-glucosaminyl)asparagine amidase-like isoform X2 [Corticium candelabrum]
MAQAFLSRLITGLRHVEKYEDPQLQKKARDCMPLSDMLRRADKRASESTASSADCFVIELLAWFKKEFFRWCNQPNCSTCGGKTEASGHGVPTPEERRHEAGRVELYRCCACGAETRFPRYNDPGKLLETRVGRCGEWANCFTLCCRAAGLEARHVVDWTDHVWTEVFSQSQQRWLHCDPCENVCDKPLLYEAGWKKKLSYVMAYSKDEVVDVTWRYSAKHQDIQTRRTECPEDWLAHTLYSLNLQVGYVFKPSVEEVSLGMLCICYDAVRDAYYRSMVSDLHTDSTPTLEGWKNGVFTSSRVFRKEELDWNKVYLSREEGSLQGCVSWKIDLSGTGVVAECVLIKAEHKCFSSGKVEWTVATDDAKSLSVPLGGPNAIDISELNGAESCLITASLSGGEGDTAWQHAQLFRSSSNEPLVCSLEIIVSLKQKE